MPVRYDQKTKDEVVAFIQEFNKKNGRGGQSAAVKKYKVTALTISKWLKKAGVKTGGKKRKVKAVAPKAAAKPKAKAKRAKRGAGRSRKVAAPAPSSGSVAGILSRMAAIHGEIDSLQAEFNRLKAKL